MKTLALLLVLLVVIFLAACPRPTAVDPGSGVPVEPGVSIETDTARGQAVYVNEDGQRFDIVAVGEDGADVACAEAIDIAVMDPEPEASPSAGKNASAAPLAPGLKAIIVGRRADGSFGLWAVHRDDTIHLVLCEGGDRSAPTLPACGDRDGLLDGRMGWRYHVTGSATDGSSTIVVGYAVNELGFHRGPWTIEPGTTVGVYWKVARHPRFPFCVVSPARVIGVPDPMWQPPWRRNRHEPIGWQRSLRLFLKGYFEAYLVMTTGVAWDAARTLFVVPGTDQDGSPAEATIDRSGRIAIAAVQADLPDLAVSPLVVPGGLLRTSDTWRLAASVRNDGAGPASAVVVRFRLSRDAVLDAADPVAGEITISSIGPGTSAEALLSDAFSITEPGTRWIFVIADPDGVIEEKREDNNTASASVAVLYERLVIDTYKPTGGVGQLGQTDTFASLFGALGEAGGVLAEKDNGNPLYPLMARIDYRSTAGIAPGTVLYVRVRGNTPSVFGSYAIRLVTSSPDPYASTWFFASAGNDAGYESDDATDNGIPIRPVLLAVGEKLNRSLVPNDVDWVKLVLP
jgi:hypothetical protein